MIPQFPEAGPSVDLVHLAEVAGSYFWSMGYQMLPVALAFGAAIAGVIGFLAAGTVNALAADYLKDTFRLVLRPKPRLSNDPVSTDLAEEKRAWELLTLRAAEIEVLKKENENIRVQLVNERAKNCALARELLRLGETMLR